MGGGSLHEMYRQEQRPIASGQSGSPSAHRLIRRIINPKRPTAELVVV